MPIEYIWGYDYDELKDALLVTPGPDDDLERRDAVRRALRGIAERVAEERVGGTGFGVLVDSSGRALAAPEGRALGAVQAGVGERQFDVGEGGGARHEVEGLEDEPELAVAQVGELVLVEVVASVPSIR